MDVYFDSGALVKLYVKEHYSEEVATLASAEEQIPLLPLHELEIRNALRALLGRGIILDKEYERAMDAFEADIKANRLKLFSPDWFSIYKNAEELSHKHTKYILCRALDILHVSSALCFSCSRFVTGDKKQAKLANETKLDVHLLGDGC